jgi:hypothetical protein
MPEGHQSGDVFDIAKNTITVDSSSEDVGSGWFTTPPCGRRPHQAAQRRQRSFAAAAATAAAPTMTTAPPNTTSGPATTEMTKADLDKLPKPDVIRTFNQRFNGGMPANTKLSKDAVIASYLAKVSSSILGAAHTFANNDADNNNSGNSNINAGSIPDLAHTPPASRSVNSDPDVKSTLKFAHANPISDATSLHSTDTHPAILPANSRSTDATQCAPSLPSLQRVSHPLDFDHTRTSTPDTTHTSPAPRLAS